MITKKIKAKKLTIKYFARAILSKALILVALEIFFFLCTPNCKGILAPLYYENSIGMVGDILFRIIFYALYVFEIYMIFSDIIYSKLYPTFMRNPQNLILTFIICRITIDLLNICIYNIFVEPISAFAICLTEVLFISLISYLTANFISEGKFKFTKNKGTMTAIIISTALVIFCGIFFAIEYKTYYDIILKYTPSSNIYKAYFENLPFRMELLSLSVMCVLTISCFACFYILALNCGCVTDIKKENEGKKFYILDIFVRVLALFFCVLFLYCIKSIIYPVGTFGIVPPIHTHESNLNEEIRSFGDEYVQIEAERITDYGSDSTTIVMNKKYTDITYKNKPVLSVAYYSPLYNTLYYPHKDIDTKYTEQDSMLSTSNIMYYGNFGIVFLDGNTAYSVKTEAISHHKETPILTEAVKKMISDGYWDYFEYGCDYLLKYDPEFIKPYIDRYANGDFSDNELNLNKDIKTQYMINFAKDMEKT